jgi:NAD(P)H-dependent flavin oxidoreductase YrpB (nitropropane dioxygenase family)
MPCGQGVGAINQLTPAGDVVRDIMAEADRLLDQLTSVRR